VSEEVNFSKEVFQLKRSDDIYPITIVRGMHHSVADNQSEFAFEMGQIASNSQFHLQLNSFKSQVEKILKEKAQELPEPPRDCRRLNILREYDNEKTNLHS